jgi:glycosyltransferase involved in cell wall biosynthesis
MQTTGREIFDFTVILPCLNEEHTLNACIREAIEGAQSAGFVVEVIVADNGSQDSSVEIAKASGARVVNVPTRGYGAALDAGIRASNTDIVVMADADMSYDLGNASTFYEKMKAENLDLLVGNRFVGGIEPKAMPRLHRFLGNPALSGIARLFFDLPIGDFHCGMRGIRKDKYLLVEPKTTGMEYATEMIVRFANEQANIGEIPTILRRDGRDRPPHLRSFPDGWRHLKFMFLFAPQFLLLLPGTLISFVGFLLLASYAVLGHINLGFANVDVQGSILSLVLLVIGLQLFSAGATAVAYAKTKGVGRFRWLPISYSRVRARLAIGLPLGMIIVGTVGWIIAMVKWFAIGAGHADPIAFTRISIPSSGLIIGGTQLFLAMLQIRQILSEFW